ncbi:MAG: helix-hairpin-helix domain-containing protein, partial [candidate division Zixibacteria bacterium]|nr:helix-hairpin-helix domain-containing protein [candidate division Zixibacteria bacterium]
MNQADREDLELLPWLSSEQIEAILHRHGDFTNLESLALVPGIDTDMIDRLRPFVRLRPVVDGVQGRFRFAHDHSEQQTRPNRRVREIETDMEIHGRFRWGGRVKQNAQGVSPKWRAGYMAVKGINRIEQIVWGMFRADFGRGLLLGRPVPVSGAEGFATPVHTSVRSIRPTLSETRLRGGALALQVGTVRIAALTGRSGLGGKVTGWHMDQIRPSYRWGVSAAHGDSGEIDGRRMGMDFDIRSGPVSLSGEVAGGTRGYKGVYTIMRWDTKNRDGGFAFRALESQKSRRASSDRHAAVWIRFRPDRKTLARLWTGIRFENGVTVATYSAGLRRR